MSLPGGLFLDTVYDASGLTLVVVADPPDLDCNDNGIVDDYDIATGSSADCNDNGVPDECENRIRLETVQTPLEPQDVQPVPPP